MTSGDAAAECHAARALVGDRPQAQRVMWRVQRIAWGVLGLFVAVTCSGLFGSVGPLAERTVHEGRGGLAVTHDSVVRQSRPTIWSVLLPAGTHTLTLRDPATELFEPRLILPRPARETWADGVVAMAFHRTDDGPMRVQLILVPTAPGRHVVDVGAGAWTTTLAIVTLP